MKKGVIALILLAVLVIIVSPGIVGKIAEQSVGDNLNWAAEQSGELVVTSDGFDRGWFSSEGQHRVALGDGQLRAVVSGLAGTTDAGALPVLLINTHIDHGLIPFSSMGREGGSLEPGLGSTVSTLAVDSGTGEVVDLPGTIYSTIGLGGNLDSRYVLDAGLENVDGGLVTWEPTTINIVSSAGSGKVEFDGDLGAMTFGNDQQVVAIDGITFEGEQEPTSYGFNVGDIDMSMGAMTVTVAGQNTGGMQGFSLKGSSSVDGGEADAAMHMEISGQMVPGFGDVSVIANLTISDLDAESLGAVTTRLNEMAGSQDPTQSMLYAEEELKGLFAAGFEVDINQFDLGLPMGTVETMMSFEFPSSDGATFEWTSLLLGTTAKIDVAVPEALIQLATSMDPQAGALIALGYLKKDGGVYIMDAELKQGLLTINGAPVPIPLGAFQ